MHKRKIAVLMGGPTAEYAVSVGSGTQVVRALTALGHTALPILISQHETWHELNLQTLLAAKTNLEQTDQDSVTLLADAKVITPLIGLQELGAELIFIAMHGPYGEDGKVQALLELLRLPYVGSGVLASALSMDKVQFRRVMKAEQLPIPEYCTFTNESAEEIERSVKNILGQLPVVVKPSDQGSSIGVSLVHQWKDLNKAVTIARKTGASVLVDRFIEGRECTVGVLGTKKLTALPVTEIIPEGEFFDYNAKYLSTLTKEICPATFEPSVTAQLQQLAVAVFQAVGAAGFSRVDFMVDTKDRPYILEINTIPGLTQASLLPKAAAAAGLNFTQLIQRLLDEAIAPV